MLTTPSAKIPAVEHMVHKLLRKAESWTLNVAVDEKATVPPINPNSSKFSGVTTFRMKRHRERVRKPPVWATALPLKFAALESNSESAT